MKKTFTALLISAFFSSPSFSSPLEGRMDSGYDLPYLWDSYPGYSNSDWMAGIDDDKTYPRYPFQELIIRYQLKGMYTR